MKTTAEVSQRSDGKLGSKAGHVYITNLVDTSKFDVKALERKVKAEKPVEVEVDISDKTVEQVINKLWGYAKYNYVRAVYGIPESFRFP